MRAVSAFALSSVVACASPEAEPPGLWHTPPGGSVEGPGASDSATVLGGVGCPPSSPGELAECVRAERALADGDALALHFGPDEFLGLISGEHRAPLSWKSNGAPAGRSTELALAIEPRGEVRFVARELPPGSGFADEITFGNTGGRYLRCADRLAVDARLRVSTTDGALDEVFDTTVEADSGRYARAVVTLLAEDLAGSLEASVASPQGRAQVSPTQLTLAFGVSELGLEAGFGAHAEFEGASVETGNPCNRLGDAVLDPSCPSGSFPLRGNEELFGLSFAGALGELNASSPAVLEDTGARLELGVDASPDSACISIDTPGVLPYVTEFPAHVWLESSDGRVGGSMEVQLHAEALDGAMHRVTAHTGYLQPVPDDLSELAPSYAILEPLVWSQHEHGGFEFLAEATEQSAGGTLRAIGAELGCNSARPCEEVCPGPGCTATDTEKWSVRWGELSDAAALSLNPRPRHD